MRKRYQPLGRPLPAFVLLPMPKGLTRWHATRLAARRHVLGADGAAQDAPASNEAYRAAMRFYVDDLFALIALVRSFIVSGGADTKVATVWLERLSSELESFDIDLEAGCLDSTVHIDDLSGLDQLLRECPLFETAEDGAPEPFPWNMLNFWLEEFRRRGWELINVAIGGVIGYQAVATSIRSVKYPLR